VRLSHGGNAVMADIATIVMGALNIAADPHPAGIYRALFDGAVDVPVRLWGSDWAKITKPIDRESKSPSFYGRVLVWTEIDRDGKWLNQDEDREATAIEKKEIRIPEKLDPNFRSFNFVFLEERHLLILEYRNELGEHFGAQRAEKLFRKLFVKDEPDEDQPVVEVTVVPSTEALEKIFAIPKLRKLEINVVRPNPDSLDEQEERILKKLLDQGAKEQTIILKKRAGVQKLEPNGETKMLATVAANNGSVSGEGKDEDGKPVFESTKDHPKTITAEIIGTSSISTFFAKLGLF
jgi:hypothetical protein